MADEYIKKSDAEEYLSQPITMSTCLSVEECKTRRRQQEVDLLLLRSIPAADVQPVRHGRYITDDMGDSSCSECGERYLDVTQNYCPNCGAKMDGESEENDVIYPSDDELEMGFDPYLGCYTEDC